MQKFDNQMVDAIRKKYPSIFGWVLTKYTNEMACEIAFLDSLDEDFYCKHKCKDVCEMMNNIEDIVEDDYKKFCDGLFDSNVFNCINQDEFADFMRDKFGWHSHEVTTLYFW